MCDLPDRRRIPDRRRKESGIEISPAAMNPEPIVTDEPEFEKLRFYQNGSCAYPSGGLSPRRLPPLCAR